MGDGRDILERRRGISTRPTGARVRFPGLEVFAQRAGRALAVHERPLLPDEREIARRVFGESLDLEAVRIVGWPVGARPHTLGNHIRIPALSVLDHGTLIHELAHVWQFQTKGLSYISDSLWHQMVDGVGEAYRVEIVPGQSIHDYTAEQQAMIIQRYFQHEALREDPEYRRMIGEVRASRPIPRLERRDFALEEAVFGPGMGVERLRPASYGREREFRMMPVLRVEF